MNIFQLCYFVARFSFRQLIYERSKLIVATLGVMFACILVFVQTGFKDSLTNSTNLLPKALKGDLFIMHKQSEAMWHTIQFPRSELSQLFAHPSVESITPLYIGLASWKNPVTKKGYAILVLGIDPFTNIFGDRFQGNELHDLAFKDTIMFDELSRPEYGPIKDLLAKGQISTEVNNIKVDIINTFKLGVSFAANANMLTSDTNFVHIFSGRSLNKIDIGILNLKQNVQAEAVKEQLKTILSPRLNIFTSQELTSYEEAYWESTAPIGFIFTVGSVLGIMVGVVIVYQILFSHIINNTKGFATLCAMGYSKNYLALTIFFISLILTIIGFIPGCIISTFLYHLIELATSLPMPMLLGKIVTVFLFILAMCLISGAIAVRKVIATNPLEAF